MTKLAFVHCRIFPGGALNVLENLIDEEAILYPGAQIKIFTIVSEFNQIKGHKIITALPQRLNKLFIKFTKTKFPILSSIFDYRNLIVFSPLLIKLLSSKIKKHNPDKIIISSFAFSKNITIPTHHTQPILTKLYLHSPMQYIRSHKQEYINKIKGWKKLLFKTIIPILQRRDLKFTKFDEVYSNSNYTAQLAKQIYKIDSQIKYPQVIAPDHDPDIQTLDYFVYIGRLVKFVKETDKIIKLFNKTGDSLIIIGSGPDEYYLKSIAQSNIIFVDWISDSQAKFDILKKAKGFINLTKESFGISTVEALVCGIPVFGYNDGATPELVDQNSGILVDSKDQHTLISQFQKFKSTNRNKQTIISSITQKLKTNN